MEKKYSIVSTVFNDETEIEELLKNIVAQTVAPAEIIIVDGGSSDKTVCKAEQFKTDIRVRIIKGKRLNISEGLNEGIKIAASQYIGIAMTGNRYENDFFEELLKTLTEQKVEIAYGPIYGEETTAFSRLYNEAFFNGSQGKNMCLPSNHGVMIKRTVFEKVGLYYDKFIYAGEDAEFFMRTLKKGIKWSYTDSAKLYWKTPESLKQYYKQKRVYTIADMQIYSGKALIKKYILSEILIFATACLMILAGIWKLPCAAAVPIVEMMFFLFAYKLVKGYSFKRTLLYLLELLLPMYYICRNAKYLKKKYRVRLNEENNV